MPNTNTDYWEAIAKKKKKVSAYILFLNPKERQYGVMGFVIQGGDQNSI